MDCSIKIKEEKGGWTAKIVVKGTSVPMKSTIKYKKSEKAAFKAAIYRLSAIYL
jgi:hypothetical protein